MQGEQKFYSGTSKPGPFKHRRIRHPASFIPAWVYSGAARKGWPPAWNKFQVWKDSPPAGTRKFYP